VTVVDAAIARLVSHVAAANAATTDATQRVSVYDGYVPPAPTSRYFLVWTFTSRLDALAVDGEFRDKSGTFQVTAVGSTRAIVEKLLDEANVALCGWKPVVSGLNCHPIEPVEDPSQDTIARDDSIADRQVMFGAARFRWAAELPI
jgi:hypothetical protein